MPADSGIGMPLTAPVATIDMMSLRMVLRSSVTSAGSPFSAPFLPANQPFAVGASLMMSSICSSFRPSRVPSASASDVAWMKAARPRLMQSFIA